MDRFYTPPKLAQEMVKAISLRAPRRIADFAVGTGELLFAAENRWKSAKLFATDINTATVSFHRRKNPHWLSSACDFLNANSRSRAKALKSLTSADVILLNPPFSCRGAQKYSVRFKRQELKCGLALAFICNSLNYLNSGGELITILPAGSLVSERDAGAWNLLRQEYCVEVLARNGSDTFRGCTVNTAIVKFSRQGELRPLSIPTLRGSTSKLLLKRGTVQMHKVRKLRNDTLPLVHTTDLANSRVHVNGTVAREPCVKIEGPALLFPRVGNPRKDKVAVYHSKRSIAISDCIIGLPCDSAEAANRILRLVLAHWGQFKDLYTGTCAPFVTLQRLGEFIESIA